MPSNILKKIVAAKHEEVAGDPAGFLKSLILTGGGQE